MKLAISNIAWQPEREPEVFGELREIGVTGIEIAPTKIWPDWCGATISAAKAYRSRMVDEGLDIPAFQAILYGKSELQVFDTKTHSGFVEHIQSVAELASAMGARALVFGSPRNRRRNELPEAAARNMALELFGKLGGVCASHGVKLAIEHNPTEYGCDFLTRAAEVRSFVDELKSPGVQLHLDSGGLHMCGDATKEQVANAAPLAHYHASEPMLAPIGSAEDGNNVPHAALSQYLRGISYDGWVSIEMKTPETESEFESAIRIAAAAYLG